MSHKIILGLGNLYVETNYFGVENNGKSDLLLGNEYSGSGYEIRLGGSAVNFITQLNKFGLNVGIIGKTGEDKSAETLFELFKSESVRTDLIKKSPKHQTNVDTGIIFSHNAQNIQIVAGSANQSLSLEDIDFGADIFNDVEAVYFGGSFKQKLLWPHYPEIFSKLSKKNIRLFLDPGRVPVDAPNEWIEILKEILPLTTIYFPNDKEILRVSSKDNIKDALILINSWGAKNTVVKMGEKGCTVSNEDNIFDVEGFKVQAVNTVGAGDCFNAAFISQYVEGKSFKECAVFANAAAALRVSKNIQPNLNEVIEFMK